MRRGGAALVLLVVWLGCAGAQPGAPLPCAELAQLGGEDGIGGTGLGGDDDGIGGTGLGDDDGIGGTGIFGTITGLGSICVNGLRIHTAEAPTVMRDGAAAEPGALAVGRVVWVVAEARDGVLQARALELITAVRGRVEAIWPAERRFQVAGIQVEVPAGAVLLGPSAGPLDLAAGDTVEVSGLWRDPRHVVASRIDRLSAATPWVGEPLDAVRRARGLAWLSLEGYLEPAPRPGAFALHGLGIELPLRRPPVAGARVWARGPVENGRWTAERISEWPEGSAPFWPSRKPGAEPGPQIAPPVPRPDGPDRIGPPDPVPPVDFEPQPRLDRFEPADRTPRPDAR